MPNNLMKLVASVLAQKRALDAKERQLIDSLNRVLPEMGYEVVPTTSNGRGAGSAGRRTSRPLAAGGARPSVKTLVCEQCGRRFGHPLHLGRHTAAMHKNGSAAAKTSRPRRRRRRSGKGGRAKS